MAEETGQRTAEQLKYLLDNISQFSFYQAVQFLQRIWPDSAPVGYEGPADQERVRLRPTVSLSFPPADMEHAEVLGEQDRVSLTTTFLGLVGSDSPLPYVYVEHIAQIASEEAGERVRGFLDIFHHRFLSLLFRTWRKYRPAARSGDLADPLFTRVLSFVGHNEKLHLGGARFPRLSETRLSVLRHRSASGLRFLLEKRLGYEVAIQQLVRRVVPIPPEQHTSLGRGNCELGSTFVVGKNIVDRNKVRIKILAKDFEMFKHLVPGQPDFLQIEDVMQSYLRTHTDHDVEVRLEHEHVPEWELGSRKLPLGFGMWLGRPKDGAVCRWRTKAA